MSIGFCVVAVGNAFDGMRLIGPFNNEEEATAWAGSEANVWGRVGDNDWLIVPVEAQKNSHGEVTIGTRPRGNAATCGVVLSVANGAFLHWCDDRPLGFVALAEQDARTWATENGFRIVEGE